MNITNNGKTKIAELATVVGIAAVMPVMLGGLINVEVSDVNVLSADCTQASS